MQTADQLNLFSAPPPTAHATMQTVMVKSHPRRVRASTSLPYAPGSETSRQAAEKAGGTAPAHGPPLPSPPPSLPPPGSSRYPAQRAGSWKPVHGAGGS